MMPRSLFIYALIAGLPLAGRTEGDTFYVAHLDASQVLNNESNSTATGTAEFVLNDAGTHLTYSLQLQGVDLTPVAANRTEPNDVVGIHLHLHVPDLIGPHILNIFGLPSEDDADLVVDFENESLWGIYDMSDGIDPATGQTYFQDDPFATKLIANWIDELNDGELYIAVHTRQPTNEAPPGVAIRGNIGLVPEPSTSVLIVCWILVGWSTNRSNLLRVRSNRETSS